MSMKVKIYKIKSNPNNPRLIKDDKFRKLVKSIKDFPEMLEKRPLICSTDEEGNYIVLGGNMRLKASKEAGLKEMPIILADDWSEEQRKEFIIKDNVGFGEWDWDDLANEWNLEDLQDWGLDLPGDLTFEEVEAEEDDYEMPDEIKTDIVKGDIIEIGEHRLMCGDSTDSDKVSKLMNGEKADMVFTDPPYGMNLDVSNSDNLGGKGKWKNKAKNYSSVIGDGEDFTNELIDTIFINFDYVKEIFIWGADYFAELIPNRKEGSWLVWDKRKGVEDMKLTFSEFELCWSKVKHLREMVRITWSGILGTEQEFDHKRHHPTQKPTKLSRWFIEKHSKQNSLIADLYLGSGSTMLAAHQLKRKCYGMELDEKYCQVIIDRMLKLDENLEVKINGKTYGK